MNRENTPERQELISKHMDEVSKAVRVFLRQHPEFEHLGDDFMSEGSARLVDTVDRWLNGSVKKFLPYLRLSIRSGLWEAARTDDVIQSPRNCSARQNRDQDLCAYPKNQATPPIEGDEQLLEAACIDESDQLIIRMLRGGNTLRNIADELLMTPIELQARGEAIARRLRDLLYGKPS